MNYKTGLLMIVLAMMLALGGCAQPLPPVQNTAVSHYNTDFASRIDLNVHYESTPMASFASIYMGNPKLNKVALWLVLDHSIPGEKVNRETLVYEGNDKTLHKIYRLPKGEIGAKGTLYVKVLNTIGRELLRSPVVYISSKGETK